MDNKANVEVLLSSYNGEKYIQQQLDSLINQKGDFNLKISARDDGSRDGTRDVLKFYQNTHNINVTYGDNVGVNASMMLLVQESEKDFDYFAFCDQDDVWFPERIGKAVSALEEYPKGAPVLWSCMEELTDENLIPYSLMPHPKYLGEFNNAVIQNKTAGHTQVFNRSLRDIFIEYPPEKMYVYDWALYILASAFGTVCYYNKVCGQYRQHKSNTIGFETNPLMQIPRRMKKMFGGDLKQITKQISYIYNHFGNMLADEHRRELRLYLENRRNFYRRTKYAFTTKLKRDSALESLQFRLLYALGFF